MKTIAIIPAGGKGKRSSSAVPKQYLKFNGKELIAYTLEVFQRNKLVDEIYVSAEKKYFKLLNGLKETYRLTKIKNLVEGGRERQDSVYNSLLSFSAGKDDLIIVHDAARPLLPQDVLTTAIKTAKEKGNALVCIKAGDTLIKGKKTVAGYLDRNEIYYVQTPQIFKYADLMKAMKKAYEENFIGTDESTLIKRIGKKVHIAEGSVFNFKVTTKEDIILLKSILNKN